MIIHKKSTPYHPEANGRIESTSKILCTVLTKVVNQEKSGLGDEVTFSFLDVQCGI